MSYSTSVVNGLRVNNFEFRDTEGRLVREETDTLGSQGQLIQKNITFFNEAGQKISQRMAGLEDIGAWRDDEAVWTYNSDGSLVVNNRVVFTNPDGTQEFRVIQIKEEADGTSTGRGESRDKNGNKIFDIEMEYRVDETERVDVVKYTYPDGRVSTERTRNQNDGTEIRRTVDENAAGQEIKSTFFQLNPDGSYNRSSTSTTYRDNGKRFVSQTNEYMDANGNRSKESISYNIDENGVGSGKGVYTEGNSRRAIMLIDFRNDERNGRIHPPEGGIVHDVAPCGRELRGQFARSGAPGAEYRHCRLCGDGFLRRYHRPFFPKGLYLAPVRARRCDREKFRYGESPLFQYFQHFGAHEAGGSDNCNFHSLF